MYANMAGLYLANLFVLLIADCISCSRVTRTVSLNPFVIETVCSESIKQFHNSTKTIKRHKQIVHKIICGTKCSEEVDCVAFGYLQKRKLCLLYSDMMTEMTAICWARTWDYGEVIII